MLDLLSKYSVEEIITFIVILCLAIKGSVSFFDWAKERLKKSFDEEDVQIKEIESIQDELNEDKKNFDNVYQAYQELESSLKEVADKVDLLIKSDKDDIKAYITEKHHEFCKQEWIDDYTMDCIERRYEHYVEERGNSFVKKLMEELRELPNCPRKE